MSWVYCLRVLGPWVWDLGFLRSGVGLVQCSDEPALSTVPSKGPLKIPLRDPLYSVEGLGLAGFKISPLQETIEKMRSSALLHPPREQVLHGCSGFPFCGLGNNMSPTLSPAPVGVSRRFFLRLVSVVSWAQIPIERSYIPKTLKRNPERRDTLSVPFLNRVLDGARPSSLLIVM